MSKNKRVLGLLINDISTMEFYTNRQRLVLQAQLPTAEELNEANGLITEAIAALQVEDETTGFEKLMRAALDKYRTHHPNAPQIPFSLAYVGGCFIFLQGWVYVGQFTVFSSYKQASFGG